MGCDSLTSLLRMVEYRLGHQVLQAHFGNLYFLLIPVVLVCIWYQDVILSKKIRIASRAILVIAAVLVFVSYFVFDGFFTNPNNFARTVTNLAVVAVCFLYLIDLTYYSDVVYLHQEPFFYVVIGLLINACGGLPLWAISGTDSGLLNHFYAIHQISNVILMFFIALAFLLHVKQVDHGE